MRYQRTHALKNLSLNLHKLSHWIVTPTTREHLQSYAKDYNCFGRFGEMQKVETLFLFFSLFLCLENRPKALFALESYEVP